MNRFAKSQLSRLGLPLAACALALAGCAPDAQRAASVANDDVTLRLGPTPAFANARLAAVLGDRLPDPSRFRVEWRRNGALVAGATTGELAPGQFRRGDHVAVRVVAVGPGGPAREWTAGTDVRNSPPSLGRVTIVMDEAGGGAELRATAECVDPDGDTPAFEYAWSRNGAAIDGARGPALATAALARGDRVSVTVVARDDADASPPRTSEPFVLENRPPSFVSRPAAPRPHEPAFAYSAAANDPDGDALRFELVAGPAGLTVSPAGEVRWTFPEGVARRGTHVVRLRAVDGAGGEAVQEFTLDLDALVASR